MRIIKTTALLLIAVSLCVNIAFAKEETVISGGIYEDTQFGSVNLDISIEDFLALGFTPGDSCDIVFSNGFSAEDVPFYTGYYAGVGEPLIVAYPNFDHMLIARNNAELWKFAGVTGADTVTVTLRERGKYAAVQDALNLSYSLDRADFDSDGEFANFREVRISGLREGLLFRGASPFDDSMGRAAYADSLIAENGIRFILDLSDGDSDMDAYAAADGYAMGLYNNGQVAALDLSFDVAADEFLTAVADGFRRMMREEGPVYIHCLEGKDRTGFVCLLLESLAGASEEELLADYMETFRNYYGVTAEDARYAVIVNRYFAALTDSFGGVRDGDYAGYAEAYLLRAGMTDAEVDSLRAWLTGE